MSWRPLLASVQPSVSGLCISAGRCLGGRIGVHFREGLDCVRHLMVIGAFNKTSYMEFATALIDMIHDENVPFVMQIVRSKMCLTFMTFAEDVRFGVNFRECLDCVRHLMEIGVFNKTSYMEFATALT